MDAAVSTIPALSAPTASTESDACYADARYLNYRVQTFYYTGLSSTFSWSRQDSYFEVSATSYKNTGSPGVVLDASLNLNLTANLRTYVFPMYNSQDGISINHFATAGLNIDPTTFVDNGSGTNHLTTAPAVYN
jgi:hypothetical protein